MTRRRPQSDAPNMDETKTHVLAAGREIMLAAQGALRFCKNYVESSAPTTSRPQLLDFFQKAIAVADDLGGDLMKAAPIRHAAEGVAKTVMDMMGREMASDARATKRTRPTQKTSRSNTPRPRAKSRRKPTVV